MVAVAKRDLKAGERLDGIGGFVHTGLSIMLLPPVPGKPCHRPFGRLRVTPECTQGEVLSFHDIDSGPGGVAGELWCEQSLRWPPVRRSNTARGGIEQMS